ncbi:hypothetical protein LBMAG27_14490 [Bacteroidota bacterium]|nr:hypothetical protein LBMAG27_14490 [Bacteroidota bacterium]
MLSLRPYLFILLISFCGCKKIQQLNPQLHPEWLAPIAKTSVTLETLSLLDSSQFTRKIPSLDLGFPTGITLNVPALYFSHFGPYPLPVSDWIKEIKVHTLDLTISLTNSFPITIGAGTIITIRNDADTLKNQNIISQHALPNDVLPGETFTFNVQLNDKSINDTVFFYLDNFNSPAQNNVTFTNSPSFITVGLNIIAVDLIKFYPDKTKSIHDTSDFSIDNKTNTQAVDDSTVEGKLVVYIDNAFPLNSVFQIYFLDDSKRNVIDSLFENGINLSAASTDINGSPLSAQHTVDSVLISVAHLQKIKLAKFAVTSLDLNTLNNQSQEVNANNETYLNIQVVGDLKMNFHL